MKELRNASAVLSGAFSESNACSAATLPTADIHRIGFIPDLSAFHFAQPSKLVNLYHSFPCRTSPTGFSQYLPKRDCIRVLRIFSA
jgi:hypothetical protein